MSGHTGIASVDGFHSEKLSHKCELFGVAFEVFTHSVKIHTDLIAIFGRFDSTT